MNATFGNATELIVAITALSKGLLKLVQLSLVGSILSNLLLVLGTAFFCGGLYNKTQTFSVISSQINGTLLMLAVMALIFPTILVSSGMTSSTSVLGMSRFVSLVLFAVYFAFLYFQLFTHRHLYEEEDMAEISSTKPLVKVSGTSPTTSTTSDTDSDVELNRTNSQMDDKLVKTVGGSSSSSSSSAEAVEGDEDVLGFYYSIGWLTAITLLIAVLSDALSSTIESAAEQVQIPTMFVAGIILPIVGNAAEHAGAVMFAVRGKLDLTLGVAVGSSTQIALMVMPLLVVIGWMIDQRLDLNVGQFEAFTLFLTVLMVTITIKDGTSNWLTGLCLVSAYFVVAAGFWVSLDVGL